MAETQNRMSTSPATTTQRSAAVPVYERGWTPFWSLRNEIDDIFDDFLRTGWSGWAPYRQRARVPGTRAPAAVPTLDVIEKEDEVKLIADLPGMSEEDIDVEVTDSMMTISGEKKEELEDADKAGQRYVAERHFGSFTRRVSLPEGIDQDKIDASFRNGVLTVRLPKKPEAQQIARKIAVKPAV